MSGFGNYVSDGQNYYSITDGQQCGLMSSNAMEACQQAQAFYAGTSSSSYTPNNGFAVGGSCANAGSTFQNPDGLGYVCDGANVWVDANFNIGGNGWDSTTVDDACKACQQIEANNGSQLNPQRPKYIPIGDCVNGTTQPFYDIKSDGNRWYYTLLSENTGNTNPAAACQFAINNINNKPTLQDCDLSNSQAKPCSSLGSAPLVFNYGSPGEASGSAINAMLASAITEPFTLFDNTNNKTAKMIVLVLILIAILVLIYFLFKKEEDKKAAFYFC